MATVAFAMEWVPQYRVPFYAGLRARLAAEGVEVRLVHGDPPASRRHRDDDESLPWAEVVPNRFWTIKGLELTWQPVLRRLKGADLVIVQQETGLLLNYPALLRSKLGGTPVALWGHGHNFNPADANGLAEWVKRRVTPRADWFFAYTERSAQVFAALGIPRERITVVQNAVDTSALATAVENPRADSPEIADLVAGLRHRGARVGWIASALDTWKRVPFLVEALDAIRRRVDTFEFVAVGAGADASILVEAARERPWLHPVGAVFGADKAALGAAAEITIQPGLVGLHVLDAFATATPLITADIDYHSHEIDYLQPGVNGILLDGAATADDFGRVVADLLADDEQLKSLQEGCRHSAGVYTMEAMVERYAGGVMAALAATG